MDTFWFVLNVIFFILNVPTAILCAGLMFEAYTEENGYKLIFSGLMVGLASLNAVMCIMRMA